MLDSHCPCSRSSPVHGADKKRADHQGWLVEQRYRAVLTDIAPERVLALVGPKSAISAEQQAQGYMSRWQLSQRLFTTPSTAPQLTHFLEIDVSGLDVLNPRPGTFVIPGESPLDLTGRIVRGGEF